MTAQIGRAALETVQKLQRAPSLLKVGEIFGNAIEAYGYDFFLCAAPPRPDEGPLDPLLFERWPAEWLKRYIDCNYIANDPMVKALYHEDRLPFFTWEEELKRGPHSKAALAIVCEPAAFGMRRGFVVPIMSVGGQAHAVTMAGRDGRSDPEARAELLLMSLYAYGRAKSLQHRTHRRVRLSPRRAEALQWAALGRTDREIARIMEIGETTAHKHIEAAKEAFGARTRLEAVIAAIRAGDIHI